MFPSAQSFFLSLSQYFAVLEARPARDEALKIWAGRISHPISTMTFDSKTQARCAQARPFFGTFKDSGPGHCMVLKTEDPDRFEKLLASLIEEFQPRTPTERHFVETMAVCHWRLVRNGTLQITLLKMTDSSNLGTLQLLQHEKKALKRQYCRARRTFLDLRSSKNQCFAI